MAILGSKIAAINKPIFRVDKCSFLTAEITYLRYKISNQGIKLREENVNAVLNFAVPTEVHRFLVLTSYFNK